MRLRSELAVAVCGAVKGWQVTQAQAAAWLGVTQPRLNDLLRGRIGRFSLDALIGLAERAGLAVGWRSRGLPHDRVGGTAGFRYHIAMAVQIRPSSGLTAGTHLGQNAL